MVEIKRIADGGFIGALLSTHPAMPRAGEYIRRSGALGTKPEAFLVRAVEHSLSGSVTIWVDPIGAYDGPWELR